MSAIDFCSFPYLTVVNLSFTENRGEFLEKLQRARSQIKTGTSSQPLLSKMSPVRIVVGNWTLSCRKDGELHIQNTDGQQVGDMMTEISQCSISHKF